MQHTRIQVLISGCLPPPVGGMATYYQSLLDSNLAEKVDLRFVQTSSHARELSSSGRATLFNLVAAIRDCARFARAVWTYRPQVAHIGTAFGLSFVKHSICVLIARFFRCQVLLHPHCSLSVLYSNRSGLWQWYFRKIIHSTDGVIALSQEWLQLDVIIPECKVFHLPNPVNIALYQPVLEKNLSKTQDNRPLIILYLGYLGKAKGSFDILDAAMQIRIRGEEMIFDLVGSELTPGELSQLQNKVESANLENLVRLNQPAYGDSKLEFLCSADIFVYPSYHEGVPLAVLEAMASGLPIIATKVGGLPDLVKDGINGKLIEPGRPDLLTDALCNLAQEYELRRSMQKMSYKFVSEKFSMEQHIEQLIEIYKTVLGLSVSKKE